MLFDSGLFLWFLGAVLAGFYLLARWPVARLVWLLVASYFFYGAWNPDLIWLIIASSATDYFIGRKVYEAREQKTKKAWLLVSIITNLGVLGTFKYLDFFLGSLQSLSDTMDWGWQMPVVNLLLPVGISFYTFQTLSYTIDIYRGNLEPAKSPVHFLLYVSFFPQLVAGPIVRASDFLPQLTKPLVLKPTKFQLGVLLLALGIVKKVVFADYLALHYVDRVFDNPELYSSAEVLLGVYAYAVQIYCDFSGYSDGAIGVAMMMGLKLPMNFDRPYSSVSLQDFWRRWHISLSSWLRDYLYIPLGGSRHGPARTYYALTMTMLLGGLWHGASWNFVVWGALHGLGLAITRAIQRRFPKRGEHPPWRKFLGIAATFHFVCFAWIFFRASTWEGAWGVINQLAMVTTYTPNITTPVLLITLSALLLHWTPRAVERRSGALFLRLPGWAQGLIYAGLTAALYHFRDWESAPFIYFQF